MPVTPQDILKELEHVGQVVREMDGGIWDDLRCLRPTWTLDDRWKLVDKDGLTEHGQAVLRYREAHIECLVDHEIEILFEVALKVPCSWGAAVGAAIEVLQGRGMLRMLNRGALTEFGAECVRAIIRRGHAPFSRVLVVEDKHETRYFLAETEKQLHAAALAVYNDRWKRGWYPDYNHVSFGKDAWKFLQEHTGTMDGESIHLEKLENIRS